MLVIESRKGQFIKHYFIKGTQGAVTILENIGCDQLQLLSFHHKVTQILSSTQWLNYRTSIFLCWCLTYLVHVYLQESLKHF